MATLELVPDELAFFDPRIDDAYTAFMHETEDDVAVVESYEESDNEIHPDSSDVYLDFVCRTEA